jgi:uncharacterized membrane protein YeaQ/YmgE (transglycosylase-associated protein family)
MTILSWIGLGLLVGALAKYIMPGKDPGGLIVTVLIGIVGALLGGAIATRMGYAPVTGFSVYSVLVATAGALLLLIVFRLAARRR